MKKKIVMGCLFVLAATIVLLIVPISNLRKTQMLARRAMARMELANLYAAMTNYANKYGALPTGNVATIFASLRGENSNKIVFVAVDARRVDSAGEFVDPWGTPYQILVENHEVIVMSSAGQNRSFGDADDIVVKQPLNVTNASFVQPPTSK